MNPIPARILSCFRIFLFQVYREDIGIGEGWGVGGGMDG